MIQIVFCCAGTGYSPESGEVLSDPLACRHLLLNMGMWLASGPAMVSAVLRTVLALCSGQTAER
jgi:hypothetical protein